MTACSRRCDRHPCVKFDGIGQLADMRAMEECGDTHEDSRERSESVGCAAEAAAAVLAQMLAATNKVEKTLAQGGGSAISNRNNTEMRWESTAVCTCSGAPIFSQLALSFFFLSVAVCPRHGNVCRN